MKYALEYRGTPLLVYPPDWNPNRDSRADLPLELFDTEEQARKRMLEVYGQCAYNARIIEVP